MLSGLKRWLRPPQASHPEALRVETTDIARDAEQAFDEAAASWSKGDYASAERHAQEALALRHDYVDAHLLLGRLHHRRHAYEEAADSYLLASCFAPDFAEPRVQLGLLALDRGDFAEAEIELREAVRLAPDLARAHNALGAALLNLERLDEARSCFERALELDDGLVQAHSNLGYLLYRDFEEFAQGEAHIRRAVELAPGDLAAQCNLTMVLRDRPREVIALADALLNRDATLDAVRLNRGLACLKLGEWERGWSDYEARKSTRCNYVPRAMPWPEWNGDDLAGHGIYVHTEQGLGDEIMFASCVNEVIAAADRCVVECSAKLEGLFRRSFSAQVVVKPSSDERLLAAHPGIDRHVALGSLPLRLRGSAAQFPRHSGYLRPDAERVAYWRGRLDTLPGRMKVGIAWRGGVASTQRSIRSIPLEAWLPLLRLEGVDFLDMQHFESPEESRALASSHGIALHRWPEVHDDYHDTAALVAAVDVVVSVQTALVHLAGALGKDTLALISAAPEWRYQVSGAGMPWYPSVRLCRQSVLHEWDAPLREAALALQERLDAL